MIAAHTSYFERFFLTKALESSWYPSKATSKSLTLTPDYNLKCSFYYTTLVRNYISKFEAQPCLELCAKTSLIARPKE